MASTSPPLAEDIISENVCARSRLTPFPSRYISPSSYWALGSPFSDGILRRSAALAGSGSVP